MSSTPSQKSEPKSPKQIQMEEIIEYFKLEFPIDFSKPLGQFFAKSSCVACYGRGLQTWLDKKDAKLASLELCHCAKRRRDRFLDKAMVVNAMAEELKTDKLAADALEDAAWTTELRLPENPLKKEQYALIEKVKRDAEVARNMKTEAKPDEQAL